MSLSPRSPVVSVVMANYNGERFISEALNSARRQTLSEIEILVVDDASTDRSLEIAKAHARDDRRVKIIALTTNGGPGAARNAGFAAATGEWIAILDSDDLMHPSRLADLSREAENSGADICADDMLIFGDGMKPVTLLTRRQRRLSWVSPAQYIAANKLLTREPPLGYLKPLIRTSFLRQHRLAYNPELKIGEDYGLVAEALACGAKFRLSDKLGYFYRKHRNSISHRLTITDLDDMIAADERFKARFNPLDQKTDHAFEIRRRTIVRAKTYTSILDAIKAGNWLTAAASAITAPRAAALLTMPVTARLNRLRRPHHGDTVPDPKSICLISRQRLVGPTNGSSAYLLALCNALRGSGHRITLVSPSMAAFGRWPFLIFRPEMDVFESVHVRGSWSIGRRIKIAKDPRIGLAAVGAVLARLASKIGIRIPALDQTAPYSVAVPWQRDDQLYVARHAPKSSSLILLDYAFSAPALPFALAPSAKSAIIMHDFFSARAERFKELKLSDSVSSLKETSEIDLLRQADTVVAIQRSEAAEIKAILPAQHVIVTPIAVDVVAAPQPGDSRTLLFVGSNTAPNIIGLRWFLERAWPAILRAVPDARLDVAGSAGVKFTEPFPSVRFLGVVDKLDTLYSSAGVVISPLTVGSGLKIKLVEALGHGKAIVATSVTTEGCSENVLRAVTVADDPERFADEVIKLLRDDQLRRTFATRALDVARQEYSAEACYRDFLNLAKASPVSSQMTSIASAERIGNRA